MVYDRSFQAPRAVAQETLRGGHLWVCFFFCVRVFLVGVLVRVFALQVRLFIPYVMK